MKSGENIQKVTRAVKTCLDTDCPAVIDAPNKETAQTLADLIEWLGYGRLVYARVQRNDGWQVAITRK